MPYISTKTYGHECGLSVAFRQWRAESHCRFIHGYALCIKFVFSAEELDARNWVVDFGGMKSLKGWLETTFDHTLLVAEDDPYLDDIKSLGAKDVANVIVVPAVGCEAFAHLIYECTDDWLNLNGYKPRVRLSSVEVREHGANSAIYYHASKCTNPS